MREIKFRGMNKHGHFVYGYYVHGNPTGHIVDFAVNGKIHNTVCVDNKTMGQFTGLKDKKGVGIYEGDIIIAGSNNLEFKGYVKYATEIAAYWLHNNEGSLDFLSGFSEFEIVGNIHENPELLK